MTEAEFDDFFMGKALAEAEKAAAQGEVPTGCVIVVPSVDEATGEWSAAGSKILAKTHNQTEGLCDASAHAEMLALSAAFGEAGNWRLVDARLYVTKEPCPMCAGAIVLARIKKVIWGVSDPKRGGESVFGILHHPGINHHPEVLSGVKEFECKEILQSFFKQRRQK
jgi:tRNA(adenine34) deaminase